MEGHEAPHLSERQLPQGKRHETRLMRSAFCRRLDKLKQKHAQRQNVVQRAAAQSPREQVSWDDEEEDAEERASDAGTPAGNTLSLHSPSPLQTRRTGSFGPIVTWTPRLR